MPLEPCHDSGGKLPGCYIGGPSSIPGQSVGDLSGESDNGTCFLRVRRYSRDYRPLPSPSALHNHSYIIGDLQSLHLTASLNNIQLNHLSSSPGTLNGQSVTLVAAKDKTEEII